jgi:cytochrome c-type biogenesis protein CcmH
VSAPGRGRVALGGLLLALGAFAAAPRLVAQPAAPGVAAPDPETIVGPPRGQKLSGAALDTRTQEVGALLRCPVCQGLSVADSPAGMAQNMKGQVKDLLAAGYDQEQILDYFERSYGEFVRLEPPLRGVNWLVWLAPIIGLVAGLGVVAWALQRRSAAAAAPAGDGAADAAATPDGGMDSVPGADTLPDDARLAAAVRRVRELAYGWPGGLRPGGGADA